MPASKRAVIAILLLAVVLLALSGCTSTVPTVKVGLVAPFEGRYRDLGYEVIPAARLAIREWAARPEAQQLRIELVAYDDMADPTLAVEQAQKLLADPDVVVVIGHWADDTTTTTAPLYESAGVRLITVTLQAPPALLNLSPSEEAFSAAAGAHDTAALTETLRHGGDPFATFAALPGDAVGPGWTAEQAAAFSVGFAEGSGGAPPGLHSLTAYYATWLAIREVAAQHGLSITTPADYLTFDENGRRTDAPIYLYQRLDGELTLLERLR